MLAEFVAGAVLAIAPVTAPPAIQVELPSRGGSYGTVIIPKLGIRAPIRQGAGLALLDRGVGHLPSTYGPGMGGTIALFGHRITPTLGLSHGPFRYINRLRRGDRIIVRMPYGRYEYRVRGHRVVRATAWAAFKPRLLHETLLLAACHPPGSAAFRYVVRATPDAPPREAADPGQLGGAGGRR